MLVSIHLKDLSNVREKGRKLVTLAFVSRSLGPYDTFPYESLDEWPDYWGLYCLFVFNLNSISA